MSDVATANTPATTEVKKVKKVYKPDPIKQEADFVGWLKLLVRAYKTKDLEDKKAQLWGISKHIKLTEKEWTTLGEGKGLTLTSGAVFSFPVDKNFVDFKNLCVTEFGMIKTYSPKEKKVKLDENGNPIARATSADWEPVKAQKESFEKAYAEFEKAQAGNLKVILDTVQKEFQPFWRTIKPKAPKAPKAEVPVCNPTK